jgi:hypothetical protein
LTDLVSDLGRTKFKPEDYNLIKNNCNHFSNDLASVLTGSGIPSEYLTQVWILQGRSRWGWQGGGLRSQEAGGGEGPGL